MKSTEFKKSYLYEGLLKEEIRSVKLWETAGRYIAEAQLTADQITQLFQQVEQGATQAGGNRTLIGQGKDVAGAVTKAYQDLKSKVETSATMQYFDQKYEEAAAKLKQATGGDQGVMTYVQKYRDFAKAHPVAQSLIYGALIAAAGITGAGAGGAAALGLLKMTDKLLQGEKFSSAAIKGAETGALAYGASKIGDLIKGQGDTTTTTTNYQSSTTGMQPASPWDIPDSFKQRYPVDKFVYKSDGMDYYEIFDKAGNKVANFDTSNMMENFSLNASQVTALFESIAIQEGLWDQFKNRVVGSPEERAEVGQQIKQGVSKVAGAVAQKAQTVGKNITTKITADKLKNAWTAAGSPTDSDAIARLLTAQGVSNDVVTSAMNALNIAQVDTAKLPDISKLSKEQMQQLLALLDQPAGKTHTGGKVAGQVSQTPNAIRKRQARAAQKEMPAVFTSNRTAAQPAPTQQQPSLTDLVRQRQSQGMTENYAEFKQKLQEAKNK